MAHLNTQDLFVFTQMSVINALHFVSDQVLGTKLTLLI